MAVYTQHALTRLVEATFVAAGVRPAAAQATAQALVWADAQGLPTHGVYRVPFYLDHLAHGRVEGQAVPTVARARGGAVLVDAHDGFAYPALELLRSEAIRRVRDTGVCFGIVRYSHHFGAAAYHLQAIAEQGLVGLFFGNSPAAMPAWGGKRPLFGTNPIAAAFPRHEAPPIVMDFSLSEVARAKIVQAAQAGRDIPLGWALDQDGRPTTDAAAALKGQLCPVGGLKGSLLAMALELLCVSLSGSSYGFEADSFFSAEGNRPRVAQALLVIDPEALIGQRAYLDRVEDLVAAMLADEGVVLPGRRGRAAAERAQAEGIEVPAELAALLERAAG